MTSSTLPTGALRLALTGAGGMLGREIVRTARERGAPLLAWDRAALDVTAADAVKRALDDARPDVVIHAAAWTDVDGCEADPDRALGVNGTGTRNVADACREVGARLVTVSTDYVFSGDATEPYREDAPVGPLNVYGWSKLAAEEATLALGKNGCVARTAWLYAEHGKNFLVTMLKLAGERPSIEVVDDQRGSPTFAADLAEGLLNVAASGAAGVVHVVNGGETTWHGFAQAIFEGAGGRVLLQPVTSDRFPRAARRPRWSVLGGGRLAAAGVAPLPPWEDGLTRCLERLTLAARAPSRAQATGGAPSTDRSAST